MYHCCVTVPSTPIVYPQGDRSYGMCTDVLLHGAIISYYTFYAVCVYYICMCKRLVILCAKRSDYSQ